MWYFFYNVLEYMKATRNEIGSRWYITYRSLLSQTPLQLAHVMILEAN
jgi:hypothetical protein